MMLWPDLSLGGANGYRCGHDRSHDDGRRACYNAMSTVGRASGRDSDVDPDVSKIDIHQHVSRIRDHETWT